MTKKSLNKKEAFKTIQNRIQENIPRQEILNELSEQYYDKNTISALIATTIDPQTKEKYKLLNNFLLGLLALTIIAKNINRDGIIVFTFTFTNSICISASHYDNLVCFWSVEI